MIASEVVGQFPRWRALPLSEIRQRLSKFVTAHGPTRFVSLIRACGSATNSIIHGGSPASSAYFPQSERGLLTLCLRMILRQADHELTTRYFGEATTSPAPSWCLDRLCSRAPLQMRGGRRAHGCRTATTGRPCVIPDAVRVMGRQRLRQTEFDSRVGLDLTIIALCRR